MVARRTWLLIIMMVLVLVPGLAGAYPQRLDNAQLGPASRSNPFFTDILIHPVTSGRWVKLAETLYQGPTRKVYQYNTETGRMAAVSGTAQVGDRFYDAQGRLISWIARDYDSQGALTRVRYYGDYEYDANGKLVRYTRTDYDAAGGITNRYDYAYLNGLLNSQRQTAFGADGKPTTIRDYEGYTYNDQGKVTGYVRSDRDGDGNMVRSYEYTNMTQHPNGKTAGYERRDFDAAGTLTSHNDYTFDTEGRTSTLLSTKFDGAGNITGSTQQGNYAYDAQNRVLQYDRTDRDAGGAVTKNSEYRDYSYHANGKTAAYVRTDKDSGGVITARTEYQYSTLGLVSAQNQRVYVNGEATQGYRYSDYVYNNAQQSTSFRLDYTDAGGAVTQTLFRTQQSYDANNRIASYTDKRYSPAGAFTSWYDYANRTYDGSGTLIAYDWVRRDAGGNQIGSGHWVKS